ncbi:MAG: hypothetical protein JWM53_6230 [bacterium]|nr:hypothetical protein [bacterium]
MRVKRNRVVVALMLATVLVGGQLASLAHFAATPHLECSDDGELIHVAAVALPASVPSTVDEDANLPDRPHRHEHCQIVSMRRAQLVRAARRSATAPEPRVAYGRTCTPIAEPRPPTIAILRQAPKSSPPIDRTCWPPCKENDFEGDRNEV